ncbi:acetyl-CoA synthetase-like protein [Martensiomyces pterosporus]|nr:acetyl-CoA synthetase-like protein [Martensiomyces pterosporus]
MAANNTLASIFRNASTDPAILTTASSDPQSITLTYADVKAQSERFRQQANALYGSEIPVGTVISSFLPNGLNCLLVFLATALQRCIAAPLNPAMKQGEVEFYLEDANSKVFIVPDTVGEDNEGVKAARKLSVAVWTVGWDSDKGINLSVLGSAEAASSAQEYAPVEPTPDDVALLLHTSGTTGRPKAVPLTQANLARSMLNIASTYKLTKDDRSFIVMPLFHVHGLIGATLSSLFAGGSVVVPPRFSASHFWPEFTATHANWYSAVPTIHQILLRHELPEPIPAIRFIRSCSSALAPTVLAQLEEKLNAPVLEAYAMTEASHQMCSNPLPPAKHKPGSVGIPQGVELTILDDEGNKVHLGEVCIRGPNVTHGYLNNPEANAKSFTPETHWFRTGDQGYIDEDGYVILTGRIKELINRGGEKISPLELDAVLLKCPGVAEAVSFAVSDEMYGQEVNAAVVPREGATVTEEQVREFMAQNVARFKVPKRVFVAESLPRTATGKIQRRVVAEHFAGPQ